VIRSSSITRSVGHVGDYDEDAGYGTVVAADGEWFFHCTAIADGSRSIAVDAAVDFTLVAGHLGRMEARDIRPA